ncbi:MAG: SDR family NAD(P)-dependent oxidoreductase, partial [Candidatus Thorarchaeota archaeon]
MQLNLITDFEATNALYESVASRHGKLDFVFNNAGIWMMGNADAFSLDDWNRL